MLQLKQHSDTLHFSENDGSPRSAALDDSSGRESQVQNLNLEVIYDPQVINGLGVLFCESTSVATRLIQKMISDGADILYDNYLEGKRDRHSISRTYSLLERMAQQEYLFYDDINEALVNNGMEEDYEPITSHSENWKGLSVNIEKPVIVPVKAESNQTAQSRRSRGSFSMRKTDTPDSHSMKRESMVARSIFESEKATIASKMVDLSVPHEIVREEEQLRVLKERETVIKQEKLAQEAVRMQEMKEQQARLRGSQDLNKKQFTYDFDGKFILTNPVKMEKLPPFNYIVNHTVTKAVDPAAAAAKPVPASGGAGAAGSKNSDKQNSSHNTSMRQDQFDEVKNSKKQLQPLQAAQKQVEKLLTTNANDPNKDIFEHFHMANGVTLVDSVRPKQGAKFGADFDFVSANTSLLNSTLSQAGNSSIRMTKSQYNIVTRSGNLSRQNNNNRGNKLDETDFLANESALSPNSSLNFMLNDSKFRNNQSSLMSNTKRSSHQTSLIKISSQTKLLETIVNNDQEDIEIKEKQAKLKFEQEKREAENRNKIAKNPIDEFNMQIAQNKHIGDKHSKSMFPPLLAPKPNQYLRAKQAIGFLPQNPRDRVPKHVMMANLFGQRLPPPGLGKTLGHGFNGGYNPDSLESMEKILDKYQNTSVLNGSSLLH